MGIAQKVPDITPYAEVPDIMSYVEPFMQYKIIEEFNIPKRSRKMGLRLQEFLDRGGKYLRPTIVYSTVKSYRPDRLDKFLWPARSIQNDHNFFLIHDDIEDGSFFRRGKKTMHILYGVDFAINDGDYLRELAEEAMDRSSEAVEEDVYKKLHNARKEMLQTTAEGQNLEFTLRSKPLSKITEKKVFEILENKSAFYTAWTPYRYGAMISLIPDLEIDSLKPALISIGIAFQIVDDVLDLKKGKEEETGKATLEERKFGKDWLGDLEETKRTLPLARLVKRVQSGDRTYLYKMLDTNGEMRKLVRKRDDLRVRGIEKTDKRFAKVQDEIDRIKVNVVEMMKKYNTIDDSKATAEKVYKNNIGTIDKALPESEGKSELMELLEFLVYRDF